MNRTIPLASCFALLASLAACGAGLESKECKAYFEKVEECAAKAPKIKADIMKKSAEVARVNWEKNSNPLAVKAGCEAIMKTLETDPDCQ